MERFKIHLIQISRRGKSGRNRPVITRLTRTLRFHERLQSACERIPIAGPDMAGLDFDAAEERIEH